MGLYQAAQVMAEHLAQHFTYSPRQRLASDALALGSIGKVLSRVGMDVSGRGNAVAGWCNGVTGWR